MSKEESSMNLDENIASALCYVLTWLTGIIFYLLEKKNKTVRFHAMQSILTFLPLTILGWIFGWLGSPKVVYGSYGYGYTGPVDISPGITPLIWLSWIIWAAMVILWVILIIKAYQGEKFKLPVVGDIAEKHA